MTIDPVNLAYLLIAAGVVLLIAELFVPTGFVLVVIGALSALIGVGLLFVHAPLETAVTALLMVCVGGPMLGGFLFSLWPYSPMGRRLIRATEETVTIASMAGNAELEALRGKVGQTVSPLRPSGVAEFDGRRIDVITEGIMVDRGQWVKCVDVRANKVVVRPAEKPDLESFEAADFS
jgi:membrane-bound ClpP family serine protease